jgi:hypothetical protein
LAGGRHFQYDANEKTIQETLFLGDLPVSTLKQTTTGAAPNQVTATSVYYVYAAHINTPRAITRATDTKCPTTIYSSVIHPKKLN